MEKMTKIITAILFTAFCHASSILKCLGAEESYYSKIKYTGPSYKLNQDIIEELSSLSDLVITDTAYQRICRSEKDQPALKLLHDLMLKDIKIFEDENSNSMAAINLQFLRDSSGRILVKYLTYLQSLAKTPKCLEKEIPEIKSLYSRYHYLEEDIKSEQVIGNRKELDSIFIKLRSIDKILKKCNVVQEAKK